MGTIKITATIRKVILLTELALKQEPMPYTRRNWFLDISNGGPDNPNFFIVLVKCDGKAEFHVLVDFQHNDQARVENIRVGKMTVDGEDEWVYYNADYAADPWVLVRETDPTPRQP